MLGNAIEAAPIAFTVLVRSGRYVAANGAASRLSGYTRPELLTLSTDDLSADRKRTRAAIAEAFRTGHGAGIRELRRKDGSVVPMEFRLAAAELAGDPLLVAAWWPADGEEPAELEPVEEESAAVSRAQERVLGLAFQQAPIAVTVSDADAAYLALNDRACAITGYSRAELFELGAWGVVVAPRDRVGSDLLATPGIRSGEATVRCADGSTKKVEFRAATTTLGRRQVRIAVWWESGA
ncbi:MAG TPA: PAS domain S-box protein [Gaiellaceae bacterium]|nr:PAS domain S-box protein [Gaiellaceae bacterium]